MRERKEENEGGKEREGRKKDGQSHKSPRGKKGSGVFYSTKDLVKDTVWEEQFVSSIIWVYLVL